MLKGTDLEGSLVPESLILEKELSIEHDRYTDDVTQMDRESELEELVAETAADPHGDDRGTVGHATTPAARSDSMRSARPSSMRTSSVCWPSAGAPPANVAGVPWKLVG